MHHVNRQAIVRHSAKKMYDLVNEIEQYPQFLKWCFDSHIIERSDSYMLAGLTVSLAGIKQKFTTKNEYIMTNNTYKIALSLVKGPFETLKGYWMFSPLNLEASKIELHLDFNFKSGFMNGAFKRAFGKIATQLVADFVGRANDVYR